MFLCLFGGEILAADFFDETKTTTLFAFDQVSIPYSQNLRLEMRTPARHPANPVTMARGAAACRCHGCAVLRLGHSRLAASSGCGYVAFDDDAGNKVASARWRPAYAESEDGVKWTKPNLGLVEYGGNKNNNLIRTDPANLGLINLKVLADPDEPNPERRYKISTHVYARHHSRLGTLAPFASADGLSWKMLTEAKPVKAELLEKDLVLPAIHFEPCGGLYQWDGMYYVCGQNAMNAPRPVLRSRDSTLSVSRFRPLVADEQRELQCATRKILCWGPAAALGEQCHEGISVWNRLQRSARPGRAYGMARKNGRTSPLILGLWSATMV